MRVARHFSGGDPVGIALSPVRTAESSFSVVLTGLRLQCEAIPPVNWRATFSGLYETGQ